MFTKELTAKWEKSPSVRWRFKDKFHNAWNTLSFIKISWHPSISNEWKNMDVPGMCVWQGKRLCFIVCLFSEKKWLFNCYYEYQAWFLYISQFVWCMVMQIHEHVLQQCEITCMCYFWLEHFFHTIYSLRSVVVLLMMMMMYFPILSRHFHCLANTFYLIFHTLSCSHIGDLNLWISPPQSNTRIFSHSCVYVCARDRVT